jgi:hypothetical protein
MVCQLRPFVYSLGLKNNPPHIFLTPRKSRINNLWRNKQGFCRCKRAVLEFAHLLSSAVKRRGLPQQELFLGKPPSIGLQIAKLTAQVARNTNCQVRPVAIRSQIDTSVCGNPQYGYSIHGNPWSKRCRLPQSAVHIWARSLARDWIPAPAILQRESPCFKRHIFLSCDF